MKRRTPDHPKVLEFQRLLGVPKYAAVGLLELLWHFTAEFAPQGDIGKHSDEKIAAACGWIEITPYGAVVGGDHGRSARLISALCAAGILDAYHTPASGGADVSRSSQSTLHGGGADVSRSYPNGPRLVVHGWAEHMPDFVKKSLARKGLTVCVSGQRQTTADNGSLPLPKPIPTTAAAGRWQQFGDWPLSGAAIEEHFDGVDFHFLLKLTQAASAALAQVESPKIQLTDEILAKAIRTCFRGASQSGAGLYLTTVPPCIKSWALNGVRSRDSPRDDYPDPPSEMSVWKREKAERIARGEE